MPPDAVSSLLDTEEWEEEPMQSGESEQAEPGTGGSEGVREEEEEGAAGPDEEEPEEAEPEEESEDEGEEEGDEGEPEPESEDVVAAEDPEVRAFLAKYGDDPQKALKGAAELSRLLGRQARDLTKAQEQVQQLQSALVEAQTVTAGLGMPLNE